MRIRMRRNTDPETEVNELKRAEMLTEIVKSRSGTDTARPRHLQTQAGTHMIDRQTPTQRDRWALHTQRGTHMID